MVTTAVRPENITARVEGSLIGDSAPMIALRHLIGRVARSSASVMITGASGSGKELVARAIHAAGPRRSEPYVALNCGAIPAELVESELFGHERGAFTGAHNRRSGHFENADGGTLFLDEIGDMRFDMQVKLLRVLEDGLVSPVGGGRALPVDVRIICATHQNIDQAIAEGRFREDLYFRLGVVVLDLPDLASRIEDLPALIAHFQRGRPAGSVCQFDPSAIRRLMAHNWPGNVRELRNIVDRAGVLFGGETLGADGTDKLLGGRRRRAPSSGGDGSSFVDQRPSCDDVSCPIDLKAQVEQMELDRIQFALERAEGIISQAARMLTLKRTTLIEKMRKYGVERRL